MKERFDLNDFHCADQDAENDLAYLQKTIDTFNRNYDDTVIYIYGPSGAGKTFLLNSIYKAMACGNSSNRVLLYRTPDFTDDMINALVENSSTRFRERLNRADAILIDDVDWMAGKPATQDEFERILNSFWESDSKLLIVTGSRSPDELKLTERLKNRLSWGKVIGLKKNQDRPKMPWEPQLHTTVIDEDGNMLSLGESELEKYIEMNGKLMDDLPNTDK